MVVLGYLHARVRLVIVCAGCALFSSSRNVWVIILGYSEVVLKVSEREAICSSMAAMVQELVAVNKLLLREPEEFVSCQEMSAFKRAGGREGPA